MRLGFVLYDYFPFGGLQRDCLRIARLCAERGHQITIVARRWQGERPEGIQVELLGCTGWSNIARNRHFFAALQGCVSSLRLDGLIGFNRAPGLDVYYAADPCYDARIRRRHGDWYRWLPRYRHYAGLERALFSAGGATQILLLTPKEVPTFQSLYGTESDRLHVLPPGIARRSFGEEQRRTIAGAKRSELKMAPGEKLLLFVGSGFRTKGLDRVIQALAAVRRSGINARLVVIGQGSPGTFAGLARDAGVGAHIAFLGGRHDVPEFMLAADVLVHPAYSENTGTVLLEALALGLPVLCTDVCGFACHVEKAQAGLVLPSPFVQELCNKALATMLTSGQASQWQLNGLAYAAKEDLYSCHERAADIVEETVRNKLGRNGRAPVA